MSTNPLHTILARLESTLQAGGGGETMDPTLWATGGMFALGLLLAGVAVGVRNASRFTGRRVGDIGLGGCKPPPRYGPITSWTGTATRGGRVDPSPFRSIDLIGVAWITGIYIWLSLAQVAAAGAADPERTIRMVDLWVSVGFHTFMAAMVVLVIAPRIRAIDWLGLRWPGWRMLLLLAPLSVVAMWFLFAILKLAGYMTWLESLGVDTVQHSVRALQTVDDAPLLVLMGFAAIVVAPVCEEIVFRGYLYGVAKRWCGPLAGGLSTAMIFSAAHGSLVALLPLALFGLLLTWLYERTGSLWAPIAAHACFNAATVTVQLMVR